MMMAESSANLRKETDENRRRIEALAAEMKILQLQQSTVAQSLDDKHAQNRKDIHNLRNDIQTFSDRSSQQMDNMRESIHQMQLTSARAKGWWMGIGAAVTFGLDIIKHFILKN